MNVWAKVWVNAVKTPITSIKPFIALNYLRGFCHMWTKIVWKPHVRSLNLKNFTNEPPPLFLTFLSLHLRNSRNPSNLWDSLYFFARLELCYFLFPLCLDFWFLCCNSSSFSLIPSLRWEALKLSYVSSFSFPIFKLTSMIKKKGINI